MSDNYSWGRVAPNSANPEVSVNDALEAADNTVKGIDTRLATVEDLAEGGGLPDGGTQGQILAVQTAGANRVLAWIDPPTGGGEGGGGDASYPPNPVVGKVLKVKSVNPLVVEWADDLTGGGSGGGSGGAAASYIKARVTFTVDPNTFAITIVSGFNVASVVRTAAGKYKATYTAPVPAHTLPIITGRYPDMGGTAPAFVTGGPNRETASGDTSGVNNLEVYYGQYDIVEGQIVIIDPVEWQSKGGATGSGDTAPTGYKAYRLRFDTTQSMSYASIGEIEFREAAGVQQTNTGGTAFSTATGNGTTAQNAFNGDLGDRWVGEYPDKPFPKYVGYIFTSAKIIPEVMLAASGYTSEAPFTYGIEASNDTNTGLDGTWTELAKVSNGIAWAEREQRKVALPTSSVPIADKPHKYWRIFIPAGEGYYGWCMAGLDFLDKDGAAIPTTGGTPFPVSNRDGGNINIAALFDGDPNTNTNDTYGFQGGGSFIAKAWYGMQFPAGVAVRGIKITARGGSDPAVGKQSPFDYYVQWSDDGKSYTDYYHYTGDPFVVSEVRSFMFPK